MSVTPVGRPRKAAAGTLPAGPVLCAPAPCTYAAVTATRAVSRAILSAGFAIDRSSGTWNKCWSRQKGAESFEVRGTYPDVHESVNASLRGDRHTARAAMTRSALKPVVAT